LKDELPCRIVLQFLTDRGYPHHITTKILQSPTSKDFYKIFEVSS